MNICKLKKDCTVHSMIVQVCKDGFTSCLSTMEKETDYQASSESNSFCIEEKSENYKFNKFNSKSICQKYDGCNIINVVLEAKKIDSNENINPLKYILKKLHDLEYEYKGNELIVSLGTGSGVTEMAFKKLFLCFDINK